MFPLGERKDALARFPPGFSQHVANNIFDVEYYCFSIVPIVGTPYLLDPSWPLTPNTFLNLIQILHPFLDPHKRPFVVVMVFSLQNLIPA